jgi:hypothetical protein
MRDRELTYVADFTVQMAPRKYGKVPSGHPIGSLLGVCFACWVLNPTGVGSSGSQDDFLHFVCRDYLRMIRLVAFASNEWDNGPEVMPCLRLS